MKHPSLYLDWYIHVPKLKHDLRSSGLQNFTYRTTLGEVDFSLNYAHGNPEATKLLAQRYHVKPENVFVSSEGASGQNARIIRCLAESNSKKNEAIVEYPTYEPLLRLVQEYYPRVKRLERKAKYAYKLDANELRKMVSEKTGLLVLTNPHLPSGALSDADELEEVMAVAREHGFYVLCDEIYAEFKRDAVPTIFSIDGELGIVTTSFTKAYGLGGLRAGVAVAKNELVDEFYIDKLNTIGTSSNIVEMIMVKLLTEASEDLGKFQQKWTRLKNEAEGWLDEKGFKYFPSKVGVTYWVELPVKDTYKWINECAIPRFSLAAVPGTFFLFESGCKLVRSGMIRLGLGGINPDGTALDESFAVFEKALGTWR